MGNLGHKLKHELRELIPVTVFFFTASQLLALPKLFNLRSNPFEETDHISIGYDH